MKVKIPLCLHFANFMTHYCMLNATLCYVNPLLNIIKHMFELSNKFQKKKKKKKKNK
jgi:hypothetical protein